MKKISVLLLMLTALVAMSDAQAAAKRLTSIQLERQVVQLKKQLQEQSSYSEQERYAQAEKIRVLETKCNSQAEPSKKFNPYTFP